MDRRRLSDKNLVTEQAGLRLLLVGVAVSFFFGYTIKSLLSPARVAAQIEKAASHIHKDIHVTFESAKVSLSDGILPRFSVVITNAQLESAQACWMTPLLQIDELRLPISFWGILTGTSLVNNVEADNVVLTLRGSLKDCEKRNPIEQQQESAKPPLVSLSSSESSQKYKNAVSELSIQNFKIILNEYPQYPSEFLDFAVKVKSFDPKVIEVTAKTHLLRDEQYGDYLSHANLFVEYKESPEPQVQAHFFGNWREGHYSMIGNYTIADHLLNVETDLKHIPLSQVLSVLQKYDLAAKNLNGKQVWISANSRLTADVRKIREAPMEINNFHVEGDLGEMSSEQIAFTSLEPLRYKPIDIDIKKMRVERLLNFLGRHENPKILGELGSFSGRAQIEAENSIHLKGEHSGLEFIFSNKGQRELQVIDRMLGDIDFENDFWTFKVKQVEPRGGKFVGNVSLKADRDFKEAELKAHIDEMTLAPQVQKLMTNGGDIGVASLNVNAKVSKGNLSSLKGLLHIEEMNVEGMNFGKLRGDFDFLHNEISLNTKIQSLLVHLESPGATLLRQITQPEWWGEKKLELQDLSGQFSFKDLQYLQWRKFQAKIPKDKHLLTEGAWDESGHLKGFVQIHDIQKKNSSSQNFLLQGTREEPLFTVDSKSERSLRK